MSEEITAVKFNYGVKIEADQKCLKISVHHYHFLDKDLSFDIANTDTVAAYVDAKKRLEREGFIVAPLMKKDE